MNRNANRSSHSAISILPGSPSYSFTNRHVAKQRVNIDFPLALLRQIDDECRRVVVTRQAWIKMVCDERLRQACIGQETNTP